MNVRSCCFVMNLGFVVSAVVLTPVFGELCHIAHW